MRVRFEHACAGCIFALHGSKVCEVISIRCFSSNFSPPGLLFIQLDIFSMNGEVLFFGNMVRTAAC